MKTSIPLIKKVKKKPVHSDRSLQDQSLWYFSRNSISSLITSETFRRCEFLWSSSQAWISSSILICFDIYILSFNFCSVPSISNISWKTVVCFIACLIVNRSQMSHDSYGFIIFCIHFYSAKEATFVCLLFQFKPQYQLLQLCGYYR